MKKFLIGATLLISTHLSSTALAADGKWQSSVPPVAAEQAKWKSLLEEMNKRKMHFGVMAASARVLILFQDVETKQAAYQQIVSLADKGYPLQIQQSFLTGDLTPSGEYDFVNSYHLYKYIINRDKGLEKWAKHYFENIDKENFAKFFFLEAIDAYRKRDLKTAEEKLRKILSIEKRQEMAPFLTKTARTLARVLFEQEEYAKAMEIYRSYLLQLNPVIPSDWLEAAWNLYHLKRYRQALGLLYNLESASARQSGGGEGLLNLEKFTLRALIYRNLCAVGNAESLIDSFDKDFAEIIKGLKRGDPVSRYPQLAKLDVPENAEFKDYSRALASLEGESALVSTLPDKLQPLAVHLYKSEMGMLARRKKLYEDLALERAAEKLITTSEHLRFLKFDVQREKYNPETVFRPVAEASSSMIEELDGGGYRINWSQFGDFWRDERLNYEGTVPNRCVN